MSDPAADVVEEIVGVVGHAWFVWVPAGVGFAGWWGWTHEAWIGPEGWDTVRLVLAIAGVAVVVSASLRSWWVLRSWRRRVGQERASTALAKAGVRGTPVITDPEGVGGYVQLDSDEMLTPLKRRRANQALSETAGVPVELGDVDRQDRVPVRRVVEEAPAVDRLAETIPAIPFPGKVDVGILKRLHVGTRADGEPFLLNVVEGNHTLVVGATGSGKGSVEQSVLRQLAPLIHAGLLRVIFVDPKGGIEGVPVRALCERVIVCRGNNVEEVVEHFQSMVTELEASAAKVMSLGKRDHVPTRDHPATLVIIDEVASLTKYLGSSKTQREIEGCVGAMTTQGRAAGWSVLAAIQDPRKEALSIRGLFPQRVALRLSEPQEVDWVLGSATRARGADCHLIPKDRQGTAYVAKDGDPDPVKVRFAFPTDGDLADVCRRFRAPGEPVVWGLPDGVELPPLPAVDLGKAS